MPGSAQNAGIHFRLRARERIFLLADDGSFHERDGALQPEDPLTFVDGSGSYGEKLARTQLKSSETEAVVAGRATIHGHPVVLAVCDFEFLGASMGSVYGEKLVRAVERSLTSGDPLLTISASGGARMHEGPYSLMQMAKTVSALARLGREGIPHLSLLTDPCYGGVTASYTMVADVIMAEPKAMIGFAGPRVIEQITKQKLPEGFQTSEFLLEHGMIDLIVERSNLRSMLATLLDHYALARSVRLSRSPANRTGSGVARGARSERYRGGRGAGWPLPRARSRGGRIVTDVAADPASSQIQQNGQTGQDESVPWTMSAWEQVQLARHRDRPRMLDYVTALTQRLYRAPWRPHLRRRPRPDRRDRPLSRPFRDDPWSPEGS